MKTSAIIQFTGPNYCCFAAVNWPLRNTGGGSANVHVLKIKHSSGKTCFLSVISTGNIASKSSNDRVIKVNGKFGRGLGFVEGEEIMIEEVTIQPSPVKRAMLSCISSDDWEILETNAEIVTNKLLDQLRVINPGLVFPFWVTKSLSINLKIDQLDPPVEFGLLIDSSEIEIPSLKSASSPAFIFDAKKILRIHPLTIPKSPPLLPSATLLFSNINHAFVFKSSLCTTVQMNLNENSVNYFCASIKPFTNTEANKSIIVKVFLLDYADLDSCLLQYYGAVTNPPSIFLHPKLISKYNLETKTNIWLEATPTEAFESIPSQFVSINASHENVLDQEFRGFCDIVEECSLFLKSSLSLGNICHRMTGPVGSLLITGKRGSGKTTLSKHIAQSMESHPYFLHWELVSCSRLRGKKPETMAKELQNVLSKASSRAPSVIILDDMDIIAPFDKSDQQNLQEEFLHYKTCETIIESLMEYGGHQICIIATSEREETLNLYWKPRLGFHFFQKYVQIPSASISDRLAIFQLCTNCYFETIEPQNPNEKFSVEIDSSLKQEKSKRSEKEEILQQISSLHDNHSTPRVIENIAKKWVLRLLGCENDVAADSSQDVQIFQQIVKEELQFCDDYADKTTTNDRTWNQIGGMSSVKHEIKKILEWPIKYPMLFDKAPIKMPTGILLYGYSGTGKTLLGLTVASEVNAKFIHIKGPELLSKYIGASEQAVQDVFRRAKDSKPCILFFDEFDSLVPRRGHDSTGVTDRVVNQFLAEMDGIEGGLGQGVYLIAATSRPDLIDPAVLRPGRLDKHLFFDMPTKEERLDILKNISSQVNHSYDESDMDAISCQAKGFTGADIHALICTSQLSAVQEYLGKLQLNESSEMEVATDAQVLEREISVTKEHLYAAFNTITPTLQGEELRKFQKIYRSFSSLKHATREDAGTIPPNSGSFTMETGKRATLA